MLTTSERGLGLIESFEGFSSTQYNDGTGVMTIGFGTTAADVSPLPQHLTRGQAETLLHKKLMEKYEPAVRSMCVPLNQNQFDALVSLAYNVGPGFTAWQIGVDLRARNYTAASLDFLRYVHAGGRVLQGLVNRREAERALFNRPVPRFRASDPYAIYEGEYVFAGRRVNERATVLLYDKLRKHPRVNAKKLAAVQHDLTLLAGRVADVALRSSPAAWKPFHRGERFQGLIRRAHGEVVR